MSDREPLPEAEGKSGPADLPAPLDDPGAGAPDGGAGSIEMLAAALRRDAADLETYAQVLTGSLAEALPAGSVALERRRSMGDRLAGRAGRIEKVEVSLDDRRLILSLAHGRPTGEVATVVRGVVLSRTPVPLDTWAQELATAVAARALSDARARAALEKLLLGG